MIVKNEYVKIKTDKEYVLHNYIYDSYLRLFSKGQLLNEWGLAYQDENENKELRILVRRNNEEKEFTITPEEKSRYYLGINLKVAENTVGNKLYYSFHETLDFCFSIIENLKQLFTGKVSTNQLMGPVGISSVVSSTEGLKEYIYIIALISLSLGVTNLLPFPPLDGGKILLLIITAVRRKEFEEKTEMFIQSAGFFILITLSIYITCNDVWRIFK